MAKDIEKDAFGPNIWLVDEMYRRYQENPKAVGESWQEFFEDYSPGRGGSGSGISPRTEQPAGQAPVEPDEPVPLRSVPAESAEAPEDSSPLRGVAARIAENMESSLEVPTATSIRSIPAKLLEENRRIVNRYLATQQGGKVSFTHLIGWAILKGLEARPGMKVTYAEVDGKPHVVQHKHVNFGLAVDVAKKDGTRVLLVPNIKNADELDFAGFFAAYEEIIRKVRGNDLKLRTLPARR